MGFACSHPQCRTYPGLRRVLLKSPNAEFQGHWIARSVEHTELLDHLHARWHRTKLQLCLPQNHRIQMRSIGGLWLDVDRRADNTNTDGNALSVIGAALGANVAAQRVKVRANHAVRAANANVERGEGLKDGSGRLKGERQPFTAQLALDHILHNTAPQFTLESWLSNAHTPTSRSKQRGIMGCRNRQQHAQQVWSKHALLSCTLCSCGCRRISPPVAGAKLRCGAAASVMPNCSTHVRTGATRAVVLCSTSTSSRSAPIGMSSPKSTTRGTPDATGVVALYALSPGVGGSSAGTQVALSHSSYRTENPRHSA